MLKARTRHVTISETFGGYIGWENSASSMPDIDAGDCPMTLKTDIAVHHKNLDFIFRYQYGLKDWPFHHFRVGVAYNFKGKRQAASKKLLYL